MISVVVGDSWIARQSPSLVLAGSDSSFLQHFSLQGFILFLPSALVCLLILGYRVHIPWGVRLLPGHPGLTNTACSLFRANSPASSSDRMTSGWQSSIPHAVTLCSQALISTLAASVHLILRTLPHSACTSIPHVVPAFVSFSTRFAAGVPGSPHRRFG
ncbi:hypothetical protein VTN02DRAFT_3260 [Thermoascus thermophilus]